MVDGRSSRRTKTFALVCSSVHVDLCTDHVAERKEHLGQLSISELLRQVVDEEVAALRPYGDH